MSAARDDRVKELFFAALDLPVARRGDFIRERCGSDTALCAEVESLLALDETPSMFMESPPVAADLAPSAAAFSEAMLSVPARIDRIGRYEIRRTIGAGGMGIVYEAVQDDLGRAVALKVLRYGVATRQAMRRFRHEEEILGHLHHPGIAQIYDSGTFDHGEGARPYFAMELIEGRPLLAHATANEMGARERLALFAKVCDAVQYAHQKGVIHRDLKPGNILVDEHCQPKILDFGVARATDADIRTTTLETEIGQLIGTVPYMSPEQVTGDRHALDTRSDVYALGVVLYELLADRLPHDLDGRTIPEAVRIIREDDPTPLASAAQTFRGDLDTILAKALEKDRERRYQTAAHLAADIRHYLADEPIVARPASSLYQLRKFAKRNKALVGAVAAGGAVLVAASMISLVFALQARRQRDVAEWRSYVANVAAAAAALDEGAVTTARQRLARAPVRFRNWEWQYLNALADPNLPSWRVHDAAVSPVAFGLDGTLVALTAHDGSVKIWEVATDRVIQTLRVDHPNGGGVAFSADGARIAIASLDAIIQLWDVATGDRLQVLRGHDWIVSSLAFSPDGSRLVSGSMDGTIRVWDTNAGREISVLRGHESRVNTVAFSPDGTTIGSTSDDHTLRLWDATNGRETTVLSHEARVDKFAFAPDGTGIASNTTDGTTTTAVWDVRTGKPIHTLRSPESTSLAFIDDGTRLMSVGTENTMVWDVTTGDEIINVTLRGHLFPVLSPDGTLIASGSSDGVVTLSSARVYETTAMLGHSDAVNAVAFSPDDTAIASGSDDGSVRLWNAATGREIATLRGHESAVHSVAFSPDGRRLAFGSDDGTVRLWDTTTREEVAILRGHAEAVRSVCFSPDGARLASASIDKTARLWDVASGETTHTLIHESYVVSVAFDPAGRHLACGLVDTSIVIRDVSSGDLLRTLRSGDPAPPSANSPAHGDRSDMIAFSPDGRDLATAFDEGAIVVWELPRGEARRSLGSHGAQVESVAFSPDGTRLVSASRDGTVKVWSADTGEELITLRGHASGVLCVAFSSDGTRIISGSESGGIRLWDSVGQGRAQRPIEPIDGATVALVVHLEPHIAAPNTPAESAPAANTPFATTGSLIRVPGDFPTIQAAIDAAVDGDEVVVADGTWTGDGNVDLDFGGRLITVRSANGPDACTIDCEGTFDDPHRGFYFHNGEDERAVLDGFTIRSGYAAPGIVGGARGGGICCDSSRPTIRNCVITGNHASHRGGGIACSNRGGATITNCMITRNRAQIDGGGVYSIGSNPLISRCTVANNGSRFGAGIYLQFASNPVVRNCTIRANTAISVGGGIWIRSVSHPTIAGCTITGNRAWRGGGGVFCRRSTGATFSNSAITYNRTDVSGSAMYLRDSNPTVVSCTISANVAREHGAIFCTGMSQPTIINCVMWGDRPEEIYVETGEALVTYSDIEGGWPGDGNIDNDPLFVDAEAGRFTLQAGSPCIDSGNGDAVSGHAGRDLAGNPRIVDGDGDGRAVVDIGAYELLQ